jgi:hypothetical protein
MPRFFTKDKNYRANFALAISINGAQIIKGWYEISKRSFCVSIFRAKGVHSRHWLFAIAKLTDNARIKTRLCTSKSIILIYPSHAKNT